MPGLKTLSQNREIISAILDTGWSPVAKFRLLSSGISPNHLLQDAEDIIGQKACLACGNCIDVCPVVLRELDKVDLQVYRTSLHLETIVEDSCLRCYSCIKVCPQVDRPLKLLATRHRITEKIVHAWLAIAYLLTATTGILLNHFRGDWSELFVNLDSLAHKGGAVMWLLAPLVFYYFDRSHFKRTMRAIFMFGRKDLTWWKDAIKALFGLGKRPFQGEYNTGQKTWYLVVLGTMLVLGITGIVRWFWEDSLPAAIVSIIIRIHIIAALIIDVSFVYHFGRKFLIRLVKRIRQIFRDSLSFAEQQKPIEWETGGEILKEPTSILRG